MSESHSKIKMISQASLLLAIVIVLGLFPGIPIGIIPVPIVLQNLGVMLIGALLPPRIGTMVMAAFFILVAAGLPLLSGGRGGLAVFAGPTAGYLVGWLASPAAIQLLLRRFSRYNVLTVFASIMVSELLVVDLLGSIGLTMVNGIPFHVALMSNLVFIPGGIVKALVSSLIAVQVKKHM